VLCWAGIRRFAPAEAGRLRQAARFAAAPLGRPGRAGWPRWRQWRHAVVAARAGMAHLDMARQAQGLLPLPFDAALHLGEILWGNIGAADRLDFTAIGRAASFSHPAPTPKLSRPPDNTSSEAAIFAVSTGLR
jgi:hypothetical protein